MEKMKCQNPEEQQYLDLMEKILTQGEERKDRTGIGVKSIFGAQLRFSLRGGRLPLITTKKMFFRGIVEELLFFIRGETDTKKLEAKGVNIWKGNTSREFLDSRKLTYLKEGDMGKGYGFQWRRWNEDISDWGSTITQAYLNHDGIDQLAQVIENIKTDPFSRRHLISAWNISQLSEMSLPPCHYAFQFYVSQNNELSCLFNMRSTDICLGLPFNIASYALLTHLIAQCVGLKTGEVIFSGGDVHLYTNHLEAVKEQLTRLPYSFPTLHINKSIKSIVDMEQLSFEDFELENYSHYEAIKASMAV